MKFWKWLDFQQMEMQQGSWKLDRVWKIAKVENEEYENLDSNKCEECEQSSSSTT